ncbi:MAG: tetratricopeptide repeat protein, partial [Planctomycetota bacterium]|nr:tetratricopeptide repeat protein [Planctomycetota bacterium]
LRGSSKSTPVADPSNADSTAATGESSQDDWIEKRDLWQTTFQSFQVELVTPRMWGASPDYSSYLDLTASDDWNLVALGATTAFFRRADSVASEDVPSTPKPGLFRKLAFDDCRANSDVPARLEWPRPPSGYQRFLSLPERPSSSLGFRAQHELAHLSAAARGLLSMNQEDAMGLASLALRDAVAGVGEEPDNPNTFRILADIHGVLDGIESGIMSQYQLQVPTQQRFYQRLLAYRQSLTVAPDDVDVLSSLADLYFSSGRGDLALEMIDRALAVFRDQSEFDDHTLQLARRLNQVKQQLAPQIETVEGRIKEAMLQDNFDPIQLAAALHQAGFSGHALKLLEEDRLMVSGNPSAELQLAMLLVEAGRFEEASTLFAAFEQMSTDSAIPLPIVLQACWLDMALGNYPAAMSRCSKRIDQVQQASTQAMLATLPFSMPTPQFLGESNIWPASQTLVASRTLIDTASEVALLQWTLAMASIEAGKCAEASAALRDLLAGFPESQFRPLARAWLKALTGEEIAAIPPGPEPGIMFHDDSDMSDAPEPPAAETGQP